MGRHFIAIASNVGRNKTLPHPSSIADIETKCAHSYYKNSCWKKFLFGKGKQICNTPEPAFPFCSNRAMCGSPHPIPVSFFMCSFFCSSAYDTFISPTNRRHKASDPPCLIYHMHSHTQMFIPPTRGERQKCNNMYQLVFFPFRFTLANHTFYVICTNTFSLFICLHYCCCCCGPPSAALGSWLS